jgi:hypothetical protein
VIHHIRSSTMSNVMYQFTLNNDIRYCECNQVIDFWVINHDKSSITLTPICKKCLVARVKKQHIEVHAFDRMFTNYVVHFEDK